jgi:Putative prokaryotic signal transducing protein
MKTVFECAFGVEAHVISGLLRSAGIENHVLGEYLQGGAGELPVGRLVRVVVADEQAETARATITEWEGAVPEAGPLTQ